MKKHLYLLTVLLFCLSCKQTCNQKQSPKVTEEKAPVVSAADQKLLGFWVGDFIADEYKENTEFVNINKLNIALKNIIGDSVTAQSIVAGNNRMMKGKIIRGSNSISFELSEPGNEKYDGKFTFDLVNDTLKGFWEAYDQTLPVTKRSFKLTKRTFVYRANLMLPENDYYDEYSAQQKKITDTIDGQEESYTQDYYRAASESVYKINSSTQRLTEAELKNLKKLDLEILRNTIYARHGLSFKKKGYRQFFDFVDWYVPVSDNVEADLTAIEKANVKLLKRFEKYAVDNYDTFGR
jgi:hypothetical protein